MRHLTGILILLVTVLAALPASAQQDIISTAIGGGPGQMPAVDANLNLPVAVALDGKGNYFIAASSQNRVFKVDASGTLTMAAGIGIAGYGGDGVAGEATQALLNGPSSVAVDSAGNIYIADVNNFVIRKVDTTNTITTVAGIAATCTYNGDGSPATNFSLCRPTGVALDSTGSNLYIGDTGNCRVRKVILSTSTISTHAGNGTCGYSGDTGAAISAELNSPSGVAVDGSGNLYIADTSNWVIRKVSKSTAKINTVAGNNTNGFGGDAGPATSAQLSYVYQLAVNATGTTVTVADQYNWRIRQFAVGGNINTVAGSAAGGFCGDTGPATAACLYYPQGVAVDGSGNIYIADTDNERIRKVDTSLNSNTVAGNGSTTLPTLVSGIPPLGVVLYYPLGVTQDPTRNVFVGDTYNQMVRELVHVQNLVDFFAGTGVAGYNGDNQPAATAELDYPAAVARDSSGNIYIADTSNHVVRQVDVAGNISTVAGTHQSCGFSGDGGPATSALLCYPYGVFVDSANNLYIADTYNHTVREVTGGTIKTIAGINKAGYAGDGGPATSAQLYYPYGVAVDGAGNVFIADTSNCRVREVSILTKAINTVAGNGSCAFSGDGPATENSLSSPNSVQVDVNGNIFIGDTNNHRLRWVDTAGNMTTIAGTGGFGLVGDGGPATSANLAYPSGISVDSSGNLLVADQYNFRVRSISAFAALNRSASSLTFGLQSVGTTSSPQTVKVSAVGPLSIANISVSGDFTEADNCPSNLANGATCTIYVYFAPKAAGARVGGITINDNGFFSNVQTINLTGTGSAISVTGSPVAFGNQLVKTTSAAKNVTVKNAGSTAITMGNVTLNETTDFAISSNTCPAPGSPLAALASCVISLTFGPQATGTKKGSLSINDSDPTSPQIVGLSGNGTSLVALSPSSITFTPAQAVGTSSKATTVTLTNNTGAALTLGNPALTFSANYIKGTGSTCTNSLVVSNGGTCIINVVFKPTAVGYSPGTLSVADSNATSPQTVALTGTGTAVQFAPASVNFGAVTKGTQVSTSVTITNVGTTTLSMTSATISGPNSVDFTTNAANPPCATLAPGANCVFNVYFRPSVTGAEKASLNVFDNSPGSPQALALSGTGQ